MHYDIVVCGSGISGAVAAIAAGRAGCRVLLADKGAYPGGMLTAGGVGPMMTFHAGDTLVVRGITDELVTRMQAAGGSPGHVFDTTTYTYTVTPFDAECMKITLEDMLAEAGVTLLYHAMLSGAETDGERLTRVTFAVKAGTVSAEADVFIDATGDADLSFLAGVPFEKGMPGNGACQPLTMNLKVGNVDIPAVRAYIAAHPEEFPSMVNAAEAIARASRLSLNGFLPALYEAQALGELDFERECVLVFETNNPNEVIVNMSRMKDFDPTDCWQLSQAETEGRKQARQLIQFLKKRVCGFENAVLLQTSPGQVGVRSSRQIKGLYTLTQLDLRRGVRFEDTIAHGGYPIDIHPPKGGYSEEVAALTEADKHMGQGHVYSIPLRSLLNEKYVNLITVGRCISAEFMAQGAIRVSPIAGAIGHGGGAAAAVAVKQNKPPTAVDAADVRGLLALQGAYLEE